MLLKVVSYTVLLTALLYGAYRHLFSEPSSSPPYVSSSEDISSSESISTAKTVYKAVSTYLQNEGHNSKVRRSIGVSEMRNFTPFLMLDHFSVNPAAGFPDHPHRGQETITYVLWGAMEHEDFTGSKGILKPGDLQFMTAGRGVVHAEMPYAGKEVFEGDGHYAPYGGSNNVEGLQLWVDLPVDLKECDPRYRDLNGKEIPKATINGNTSFVNVISGSSYGTESVRDLAYTPVWMLDFVIPNKSDTTEIVQDVPKGFNSFLYIISGSVKIAGKIYETHTNVFFNPSNQTVEQIVVKPMKDGTRFLVIAGQILDQEIVQYGPFVEYTQERIWKAVKDYQTFSNGFERAMGWASSIGKRIKG